MVLGATNARRQIAGVWYSSRAAVGRYVARRENYSERYYEEIGRHRDSGTR